MANREDAAGVSVAPIRQLTAKVLGYWLSQLLFVAAKLGIADLLSNGARSADELALETGTHAPTLYRLLRALASEGLVAEHPERRFALTELGQPLRRDAPQSIYGALMVMETDYRAWGELLYSAQTGMPAFDHLFGMSMYDYYAADAQRAAILSEMMVASGRRFIDGLDLGSFAQAQLVVDMGGGSGSLLGLILQANPRLRGILIERAAVIEEARLRIAAAGLQDRCELVAGDFFERVPSGGDVYILSRILFNWDDERALRILRVCAAAMGSHARLIVIDPLVPAGPEPSPAKLNDIHLLVVTGGRARTEAEFHELLGRARLKITRIDPPRAGGYYCVIEAVAA